jgi:hypothetical protein
MAGQPQTRVLYVNIDSRDRDKKAYPDPNVYMVSFVETIKNVSRIELVYAQYEKFTDEHYMNLVIDECSPNSVPTNSRSVNIDAFTQLPITNTYCEYNKSMYVSAKDFLPPKAKLDRLTLRFQTTSGRKANIADHFLRFEITCMHPVHTVVSQEVSKSQDRTLKVLCHIAKQLSVLQSALPKVINVCPSMGDKPIHYNISMGDKPIHYNYRPYMYVLAAVIVLTAFLFRHKLSRPRLL